MSKGFVSEGIVFVRRDEEGVLVAVQMGQRAPIARELAGRGLGRAPLSPPPYRGSGLGSSALDRRLRAGALVDTTRKGFRTSPSMDWFNLLSSNIFPNLLQIGFLI